MLANTFDTMTALSAMYLWLLFGFFTPMLSKQLQQEVAVNPMLKQILAFVTFFFLMSVVDQSNTASIGNTIIKSVIVYALFLMSTKNTLWFSLSVIAMLVMDQLIRIEIQNRKNKGTKTLELFRTILYYLIIVTVAVGFGMYYLKQKANYGNQFTFSKFLFS